jgi:hypothetical protein
MKWSPVVQESVVICGGVPRGSILIFIDQRTSSPHSSSRLQAFRELLAWETKLWKIRCCSLPCFLKVRVLFWCWDVALLDFTALLDARTVGILSATKSMANLLIDIIVYLVYGQASTHIPCRQS